MPVSGSSGKPAFTQFINLSKSVTGLFKKEKESKSKNNYERMPALGSTLGRLKMALLGKNSRVAQSDRTSGKRPNHSENLDDSYVVVSKLLSESSEAIDGGYVVVSKLPSDGEASDDGRIVMSEWLSECSGTLEKSCLITSELV